MRECSTETGDADDTNSESSTGNSCDEDSSEVGINKPPLKKKARYACTFYPGSNKFCWAVKSKKGPTFAFCKLCHRDISVAYGGSKDLKKHELTSSLNSNSE